MQIELKIEEGCTDPKVIIITDRMTDSINRAINILSENTPEMLAGFRDDAAEVISPHDIFRIYACDGKTIAVINDKEYYLRLRLYEAEEKLGVYDFVRISNSELVNLKKVKKFDMSLSGTICVSMTDGTVTYVSRRYVKKIKQILGI